MTGFHIRGNGVGLAGAVCAAMLLASAAVKAEGASFCVTCSEPDRTYVCRVQGSGAEARALQYYCIARTAAEGGHKFCGTSRTPPDSCAGAEKSYVYDASAASPPMEAAAAPPPALNPDQARRLLPGPRGGGAPTDDGEPETVVTEGERPEGPGQRVGGAIRATSKAVGGVARNTGRRVGTAARTTVQCVRTLLRDCAPEELP